MKKFGGPWTEQKLKAFIDYVKAYLTILNVYKVKFNWQTIYFDGFAGSGEEELKVDNGLFNDLEVTEQLIYKGSFSRIISLEEPFIFDWYYFIDYDQDNIKKLENFKEQVKNIPENKIQIRYGDANVALFKLAEALKTKKYAALVFLDPFGMQISWSSIASLAGTRSDVWILIPTGVIVNRLLDRKGNLKNIKKLESFFGVSEEEIRKEFYVRQDVNTLFGEDTQIIKVNNAIDKIARLYANRLGTVWRYVTEAPLVLRNTRNFPIFHFVFATNNDKGVRIAQEIIENKQK